MNTTHNVQDTYDDIINLPHHTSAKHPRMSMSGRAAQFGSFAALRGHSQAIENTSLKHNCEENSTAEHTPEEYSTTEHNA